jgi:TonB family protein
VAKAIEEHLTLYRAIPAEGALIQFAVSREGLVQDITLARSSGHQDIDLALQRAVHEAGPFGTPPAHAAAAALSVAVTFEADAVRR